MEEQKQEIIYLEPKELSGIYFRFENLNTKKWENRTFEDLPEDKQIEILETKGDEWIKSLGLGLSKTIEEITSQFNININDYVSDINTEDLSTENKKDIVLKLAKVLRKIGDEYKISSIEDKNENDI